MNIAVAYDNGQIAKNLGGCRTFLVVSTEGQTPTGKHLAETDDDNTTALLKLASMEKLDVLICGSLGLAIRNALEMIGVLLVWFGTSSEIMLYAGSAVYGFFFASCVVLVPIVVRQIFGTREYTDIYSRISLFVNLLGGLGSTIWAFIGGSFGYPAVFTVALVLLVVVLLLGMYSFANAKSVQKEWTE